MISSRSVSALLTLVLLLLVAAVSLVRGARLAADGFQPSAVGEKKWFGWAFGDGEARRRLAELERRSGRAARIYLEPRPGDPDAGWLEVMAPYYLPASQVTVARPDDGGPPSGALVAALPEIVPPEPPSRRWTAPFTLAGGLALALVAGLPLALRGRRRTGAAAPETAALALIAGLAGVAPALVGLRLSGVALTPAPIVAAALAVAAAFSLLRRTLGAPGGAPAPPASPAPFGLPAWAGWGALGLAFAVFVWKVDLVPLWSWDHFAIWGMKARRLVAGGAAPPDFLAGPLAAGSVPWYPLGLPAAWLELALGRLPAAPFFKAAHLLFAGALLLLVRGAARAAGAGGAAATAAAALVAASPLLWDTESLGLADLPLALWAVGAVAAALRSRAAPPRWGALGGLLAGFLPWIKQEGWTLGFLLVVALSLLLARSGEAPRRRAARVAWFALPAAVVAAAAAVARLWLGEEVSWLAGDWWGRAVDRLPEAGGIAGLLGADLVRPAWLGFWLLFAAGWAAAALRRRWAAFGLGAVVVAQLALYAAIFFTTYLPPADHIRSAFFRLAAALMPLAAVSLAAVATGDRRGPGYNASAADDARRGAGAGRPERP